MEKLTKREKVILGVSAGLGVVAVGTAGYFGIKYYNANQETKILKQGMDYLSKVNNDLTHKVETLREVYGYGSERFSGESSENN